MLIFLLKPLQGLENVVTWNDIHHKTYPVPGEHGYPDEGYLDRVLDELSAHGITEEASPAADAVNGDANASLPSSSGNQSAVRM